VLKFLVSRLIHSSGTSSIGTILSIDAIGSVLSISKQVVSLSLPLDDKDDKEFVFALENIFAANSFGRSKPPPSCELSDGDGDGQIDGDGGPLLNE
jgi:hypothetical protein